jgi:hypothetical protein
LELRFECIWFKLLQVTSKISSDIIGNSSAMLIINLILKWQFSIFQLAIEQIFEFNVKTEALSRVGNVCPTYLALLKNVLQNGFKHASTGWEILEFYGWHTFSRHLRIFFKNIMQISQFFNVTKYERVFKK